MVLRLCWCVVDARRSAGRPRRIYEVECFFYYLPTSFESSATSDVEAYQA